LSLISEFIAAEPASENQFLGVELLQLNTDIR
jgi:hypothetical protein